MDIATALLAIMKLVKDSGGFVIPLFIASVLTAALFLEQYWYSLLSGRRIRRLALDPASWKALSGMDMISRMVQSLNLNQQASEAVQKRDMEMIYTHFERRIHWLSTMAAVAPMLGLIGTVSGMIRIFGVVSGGDIKDPLASLSGGISEALFATGGGLIIAIVAALGYHYLNARLESMGQEMVRWYEDHRKHLHAK